eukprot:TRINITY_DN32117_c0_g1_i1.p1 TRINITY_DN32117_c0_g1~~TRINITY_DN32117_c0_g1_i1.p1  ORF type:complete len:555 (-),score=59.59 TRINITY_DN32117_c0_g1_i1:101-1744(-)
MRLLYVIVLPLVLAQVYPPQAVYTGSGDCATKKPICIGQGDEQGNGTKFIGGWKNGSNPEIGVPLNSYNGWGHTQGPHGGTADGLCFKNQGELNSAWFWFRVATPGNIRFNIIADQSRDLDYIVWGPFSTLDAVDTCYDALTISKERDCGWQRGPTDATPAYERSLEYALLDNLQAGEYYVLLIDDQTGNSTFQLRYLATTGTAATFDCSALRGATSFVVDTHNATNITVGQPVTFYIGGLLLDARPAVRGGTVDVGDRVKTVRLDDNCLTGEPWGADRQAEDLGPDDEEGRRVVEWETTFLVGNAFFKLCYEMSGGTYVQVGDPIWVHDSRPHPPLRPREGIPAASRALQDDWISYEPSYVVSGETTVLTFSNFKPAAYSPILVKIVVADCLESWPSVNEGSQVEMDRFGQVPFTLTSIGKYVVCVKHQVEWEPVPQLLTVTTQDKLVLYNGYTSCQQFIEAQDDATCGCFFLPHVNTTSNTILPTTFASAAILQINNATAVDQGCCVRATLVREVVGVHKWPYRWGWCADDNVPHFQDERCVSPL